MSGFLKIGGGGSVLCQWTFSHPSKVTGGGQPTGRLVDTDTQSGAGSWVRVSFPGSGHQDVVLDMRAGPTVLVNWTPRGPATNKWRLAGDKTRKRRKPRRAPAGGR